VCATEGYGIGSIDGNASSLGWGCNRGLIQLREGGVLYISTARLYECGSETGSRSEEIQFAQCLLASLFCS